MPELPEVETVVRDLRPLLAGRRFKRVWTDRLSLRMPWNSTWERRIVGRCVEAVRRRGKWIVLELDDGGRLLVHLGMSGRLTVAPAQEPKDSHHHLIFDIDEGAKQLRFRDPRRFGSATLLPTDQALEIFFTTRRLGPEPFGLDPKYWRERLAATSRIVKAVLLDQTVLAGVGNIYADEALFEARLHPGRPASGLKPGEGERLRRAVETVLNRAIARRGSSIRDYVGGSGLRGEMQNEFRVYGRTGEPCPHCGAAIERMRLAGRSSHFCPMCQKKEVHHKGTKGTKKDVRRRF